MRVVIDDQNLAHRISFGYLRIRQLCKRSLNRGEDMWKVAINKGPRENAWALPEVLRSN